LLLLAFQALVEKTCAELSLQLRTMKETGDRNHLRKLFLPTAPAQQTLSKGPCPSSLRQHLSMWLTCRMYSIAKSTWINAVMEKDDK